MEINYPVFVIKSKDNMVYVFLNEKNLKTTNTNLLSENMFNNVTLVDSTGNVFKIKNAYKVKYTGFYGISLFKKGKGILIDFEFEEQKSQIKLSDFTDSVIEKIEKNKMFWQSGWDIEKLKTKINKSSSFETIANLLK